MLNNRIHKRKGIILIFVSLLAFLLTFYPHFKYPYPLHIDEWFHISEAKMIGNTDTDWYSGKKFELGMERVWHLLLASLQNIFNLSVTQWIFLPAIIHVIAIFSVYTFTAKLLGKNQALIAALLVALLPSNLAMGGPVFLMPVNLSLIFIPVALSFAFHLTGLKKECNYIGLLAVLIYLLYAHPPSALSLLVILTIYLILNVSTKEAKPLFIVMSTAILVSLPNYIPQLVRKGIQSINFNFWIVLEEIPKLYGYVPTLFFLIGFYFSSQSKKKEIWSLLLAALLFMLNIVLFVRFDINYLIPYQRTFIPLFLLTSIIASEGFVRIANSFNCVGIIVVAITLLIATYLGIARSLEAKYYYVIDKKDYENFLWIKNNTPKDAVILLDPWKARALPAIAERQVYAVMPFGPDEKQLSIVNQVNNFFSQNCTDTNFLFQTKALVVCSTTKCYNENLISVKDNIYFLKISSS